MYPWNRNWQKKGDDHNATIDTDHDHPEIIGDDATLPPESETPPPGWMPNSADSTPPSHDVPDDSDGDKPGALKLYDVHHKPFFIYDSPSDTFDDHDHYHHHHHEVVTTTTPEPPPPPVKQHYGHYPIILKLWYVHLVWGIWFIFYCIYLMLKSVGRRWVR